MKRLRRTILELWAILPLAVVAGFLGPFGTYLTGDFFSRSGRWWVLLMGAYVLVRPTMVFWNRLAEATGLPRGTFIFFGLMASSFPMAFLWEFFGRDEVRLLGGYSGLLPFTALCSVLIMVVAWWAERADTHLLHFYDGTLSRRMPPYQRSAELMRQGSVAGAMDATAIGTRSGELTARPDRPHLYARLSPRFTGDILALESEDHYVRVHGMEQSELLLLRLRDAIAEMDGSPGEQTHRSWWVARQAVAEAVGTGRQREIRLINGTRVPVARDSVDRLQRLGFLPA
ncbi:LytTR family DNA-binding domain-containing protein [Sphingobium sp. H39-3-25]|uniref:LytTR family DNA-binding domain-containing protein n=1 Tax=Sphingobium arseniciresistens TaxID=3030834 RepID=UPI0023B8F689|nr:LytTR family DNA-binding domain-containing protein [Sphingobium arseniciresistens]